MARTTDMTTGSPFKKILLFSLPIALSLMLQNLYSLGDSLIVSLSLGSDAATGVNLTGSLTFLILGCGQGLSAGFGKPSSPPFWRSEEKPSILPVKSLCV